MTDERIDEGHVVEWLDAWRTNELHPGRARVVEEHLATCPECRGALADLEAFAATVESGYRASETARSEPDWGARRATIVERTSGRRASPAPWIVRWAPQVAIMAIAVVAIGVLVEKGVRGPDDVERALRAPSAERRAAAGEEDADGAGVAETAAETEAERPGREPPARPSVDDAVPSPPARAAPEAREEDVRQMEEARVEQDRGADEAPPAAPEAEAIAGRAAPAQKATPDRAERFRSDARAALASRDTAAGRDALQFWADSVEPAELPEDRRERLEALADSLAALLSSAP